MQADYRILRQLGVEELRGNQAEIIENILTSPNDLLAVLATGGGKTLCFQYASIAFEGITIIIYPLLSLMKDQEGRFRKAGVGVVSLKGGQTKRQRDDVFKKISSGDVKAIITNPETITQKRVLDRLAPFGKFNIVFDECHTTIEWSGFRSKMLEVKTVISSLDVNKILAFTATLSKDVEKGLGEYVFFRRKYDKIYFSANRENIKYAYIKTPSPSFSLYNLLKKAERPCIVFANDRELCQRTVGFIERFLPDIESRYYHAGLSKMKKSETEQWFYKTDSGVLVATCAFGMGVDKSNIRSVIHLKLPENVSAFLQESGRAGRDGAKAMSYSIIKEGEHYKKKSSARQLLFDCFDKFLCTRKALLQALGESGVDGLKCSGCASCDGDSVEDRYYYIILALVKKYGRAISADDMVLILKGVEISNIPFCRKLSFFALFENIDICFISEYVKFAENYVKMSRKKKFWR